MNNAEGLTAGMKCLLIVKENSAQLRNNECLHLREMVDFQRHKMTRSEKIRGKLEWSEATLSGNGLSPVPL